MEKIDCGWYSENENQYRYNYISLYVIDNLLFSIKKRYR